MCGVGGMGRHVQEQAVLSVWRAALGSTRGLERRLQKVVDGKTALVDQDKKQVDEALRPIAVQEAAFLLAESYLRKGRAGRAKALFQSIQPVRELFLEDQDYPLAQAYLAKLSKPAR
jgi:hypothetical protein